jgi:hypothetical protein
MELLAKSRVMKFGAASASRFRHNEKSRKTRLGKRLGQYGSCPSYYMSGYFALFSPLYLLWRVWILSFYVISPRQAAETYAIVLQKTGDGTWGREKGTGVFSGGSGILSVKSSLTCLGKMPWARQKIALRDGSVGQRQLALDWGDVDDHARALGEHRQ